MGDFRKKREYGSCPLKMGASRSKRESWNIWLTSSSDDNNKFFQELRNMAILKV